MERVILHADMNNCYASIEAKLNPKYKLLLAEDKAYKEKISENECA